MLIYLTVLSACLSCRNIINFLLLLIYYTNTFHVVVRLYSNGPYKRSMMVRTSVTPARLSLRLPLFCSYRTLASSVIYYRRDARQHITRFFRNKLKIILFLCNKNIFLCANSVPTFLRKKLNTLSLTREKYFIHSFIPSFIHSFIHLFVNNNLIIIETYIAHFPCRT